MPQEYTNLVTALKGLTQGTAPDPVITLPMAENEWNTRPNADSYGIVALDFEADALHGDNVKQITAYEGSVDLFSRSKDGARWVELIAATLTDELIITAIATWCNMRIGNPPNYDKLLAAYNSLKGQLRLSKTYTTSEVTTE